MLHLTPYLFVPCVEIGAYLSSDSSFVYALNTCIDVTFFKLGTDVLYEQIAIFVTPLGTMYSLSIAFPLPALNASGTPTHASPFHCARYAMIVEPPILVVTRYFSPSTTSILSVLLRELSEFQNPVEEPEPLYQYPFTPST